MRAFTAANQCLAFDANASRAADGAPHQASSTREISTSQLGLLAHWLATDPEVPEGRWFKRFPEMIVCGEGSLVKTILRTGQVPTGDEVM